MTYKPANLSAPFESKEILPGSSSLHWIFAVLFQLSENPLMHNPLIQ